MPFAAARNRGRNRIRLERLEARLPLTAGTLDTSFSTDGFAVVHPGMSNFPDSGYSVATQSDGKIVVAGTAGGTGSTLNPTFALARFNADGSLDTTFGSGGQVLTPLTSGLHQGTIKGVVVESDQKIVVIGKDGTNMVLARYDTDGSLDSTFGTGGIVVVPTVNGQSFSEGDSLAVQADGKYVLVGQSMNLEFFGNTWPVIRLNHDGSVDTTFGSQGLAVGPTFGSGGTGASPTDVLVEADQKIVVIGDTGATTNQWQVARYNSDGTLDTTFGTSGLAALTFADNQQVPFQVAEQPDGKLLIAGSADGQALHSASAFELARLDADGSVDSTFNGGTPVVTSVPNENAAVGYSVAVLSSGKILLAGEVQFNTLGVENFVVQRYNADGTLDTSFGTGGTASTTLGISANTVGLALEQPVGMALQPNGGIMLMSVGEVTLFVDAGFSWVVARFTNDSTPAVLTSTTSPWQNPTNPDDVDGDGSITPNDALQIINRLNSTGPGTLAGTPGIPPVYYDVDGDGSVTPNDALTVINYLNSQAAQTNAITQNLPESASADANADSIAAAAPLPVSTDNLAVGIADSTAPRNQAAGTSGLAAGIPGSAAAQATPAISTPNSAPLAQGLTSVSSLAVHSSIYAATDDWTLEDLATGIVSIAKVRASVVRGEV